MCIFKRSMNAPRFDRWLPRAAAVRELGERGMMSLTGCKRLGKKGSGATGSGYWAEMSKRRTFRFITKGSCCVNIRHNINNNDGMFTLQHSTLQIVLTWRYFVVFCNHIAFVIQRIYLFLLWQRCNIYRQAGYGDGGEVNRRVSCRSLLF